MSSLRFVISSLVYHWRMNAAVAMGVAVGTAVLAGALLVGDSVRGSLRHLMLDRLGRIDDVLVSDRMFSTGLVTELNASPDFNASFDVALPAILLEGSSSQPDSGARANRVSLIGCDERFWKLGSGGPQRPIAEGDVVVNQSLADELAVKAGDEIVIRLPLPSDIPRDSPLGKKTELIANRRLRVAEVIAAEGLGRFGLRPNQQVPKNCYLSLADLQSALEEPDRVNAILVGGREQDSTPAESTEDHLADLLEPQLADYGLSLVETKRGYINLTSERMVLEPAVERAALAAFQGDHPQLTLTYLANFILAGPNDLGKIPYSTITALDLTDVAPLGPFTTTEGRQILELADDEILLNSWTADDLKAQGAELKPGDEIRLRYFEPESTHGRTVETTHSFKLKAIVALAGPANDPDLTPELRGVTDKASLANWDPPFPYDPDRVRTRPPHDEDERYWDEHRATPKGFVSLATGRRLWASRFGQSTSIRIPPGEERTQGSLTRKLREELAKQKKSLGFAFQPVKRQGLLAARGTTDFNQLFLGFSFFIIASAVMLVALLFRLGIERRAGEIGTLLATGFSLWQLRLLLVAEGLAVALVGGALGLAAGAAFAWLMLAGLRAPGWWLSAVSTPFLRLSYVSTLNLVSDYAIGYTIGVTVSMFAIVWALWRMSKTSLPRLLANQSGESPQLATRRPRTSRIVGWTSLVAAIAVAVAARRLSGEAQAGAFFGSGALVLTALLALSWARLRSGDTGALIVAGSSGVARLAVRNAARNPGRSTLTIALVGAAIFLIVAVSAFRLDPPEGVTRRTSGSGGFALYAESDQPLYQDLNTPDGRAELGLDAADELRLAGHDIVSFRVRPGDDASCLNLYQTQQPRVLGVPPSLVERGGFAWAASAATSAEEDANPWLLLKKPLDNKHVPVVLDAATATYSLHLGGDFGNPLGATYNMPDGRGGDLTLEVVGLLKNSIFQGDLLVSEDALLNQFPDTTGYRYFLIDVPLDEAGAVESELDRTLGDFGFDARSTRDRLAELMAVQNTYLSTFQSLGGLGLLLGTFGLAIVQLRNVLERRGELALLRAAGFGRALLGRIVMTENGLLLLSGLAVGLTAALVAVWPHLMAGGASLPWKSLGVTLGSVLIVGLAAGLIAVRATLATPLLPALRGE